MAARVYQLLLLTGTLIKEHILTFEEEIAQSKIHLFKQIAAENETNISA